MRMDDICDQNDGVVKRWLLWWMTMYAKMDIRTTTMGRA